MNKCENERENFLSSLRVMALISLQIIQFISPNPPVYYYSYMLKPPVTSQDGLVFLLDLVFLLFYFILCSPVNIVSIVFTNV